MAHYTGSILCLGCHPVQALEQYGLIDTPEHSNNHRYNLDLQNQISISAVQKIINEFLQIAQL